MKMAFVHNGEDRAREAEEWVHLISQAASASVPGRVQAPEPAMAPEARNLTDTMVFSATRTPPPSAGSPSQKSGGKSVPDRAAALAADTQTSSSAPIIYCFHCGKKLPEHANFCPFCGTRVHEAPHEEGSHLHLPLHQYGEQPATQLNEPVKKTGWRRFFGK
jgi:hypothetical protein